MGPGWASQVSLEKLHCCASVNIACVPYHPEFLKKFYYLHRALAVEAFVPNMKDCMLGLLVWTASNWTVASSQFLKKAVVLIIDDIVV